MQLHQLLTSSYSAPGESLADPPGSSVLIAAVTWFQSALLGTVATVIAVIAIASLGFMMLTGRVNLRSGAAAIVGSFVLFGASTIVVGLQFALSSSSDTIAASTLPPSPAQVPVTAVPEPVASSRPPYDPYAGASVPEP